MAEKIIIPLQVLAGEAKEALKDVTGDIEDAGKEQGYFAQKTDLLKKSFVKLKTGIKSTFKTLTTWKGLVAATGIGALVIAFGTLITYFKKSKEGSEKLDAIMAGLGATVTVLTDRIIGFGKGVISFFKGDFSDGIDAIKSSISGIGSEIAEESAQAFKLTETLQDITDAERDLKVARAENLLEVKRLDAIADDITKSEETRIEAARRGAELINESADKELELLNKKLITLKELDAQGDSSAEDLEEIADLQVQIADADAARVDMAKALVNKLNGISEARRAKEAAEREKAKAEEEKTIAEKEAAELASANKMKSLKDDNFINEIEDEKERAFALLELQKANELASVESMENSEALKSEIEKKYALKTTALLDKQAKEKKKIADLELKQRKDVGDQTLAAVGGLAGALGKLAGDSKGLAVAEATISTYLGATKALAAGAGTPVGYINAAAIIATGMANVKSILSTKIKGADAAGSPDISAGGSASVGSSIAAGIPSTTGLDDVVGSINGQKERPVRAYVIGQDVTDSQEAAKYLARQRQGM